MTSKAWTMPTIVVERSVIDRHAAVARLRDLRRQRMRIDAVGQREDVGRAES